MMVVSNQPKDHAVLWGEAQGYAAAPPSVKTQERLVGQLAA